MRISPQAEKTNYISLCIAIGKFCCIFMQVRIRRVLETSEANFAAFKVSQSTRIIINLQIIAAKVCNVTFRCVFKAHWILTCVKTSAKLRNDDSETCITDFADRPVL